MFVINEEDNSIYITRGDVAFFSVSSETEDGEAFKFHPGDVVRFKVFGKKNCENVVLSKDFGIEEETEEALIYLEEKDTKIGDVISKPVDYWYEVELNPYTDPQTIIGYDDEDGAKIFRLFPEGAEAEDDVPVTPEDIPVVDEELDLTSTRPVQNQAISRAIANIKADVKAELKIHSEEVDEAVKQVSDVEDISSKFVTEARGCSYEVHAYKQGRVISVYLSIGVDSAEECSLRVDRKYHPVHDLSFVGMGASYYFGEGHCDVCFVKGYGIGIYPKELEDVMFSFSYICDEQ